MKRTPFDLMAGLAAGAILLAFAQLPANAQLAVQRPSDVVGTGGNAWSYLILEGENYVSEANDAPGVGFTKVYGDGAVTDFYGNPVLGTNTTASNKGALFTQTTFGQFLDKATYQVQFATPGTYYLYMRFTMFENGGNTNHYLNEDSFFVPPDFDKDPQTDWPLIGPNGQTGGYTEGCCDQAGFLYIPEVGNGGVRIGHSTDPNEWEGIFHWNDLLSSQFLVSGTSGEPKVRFKYEVTPAMVGRPLNFTIGYREGGVTVDLFLFSTHTNLMDVYSQSDLDKLLVNKLTVQDPGDKVGTGSNAWSYLILEGENYYSKANETPGVGFTKVYGDGAVTNFYGNPVLGTNTTASNKGALFTQTTFGQFLDKATYQVQFATPGTYYLYMRFTMFENGGNTNHYLNEDSFFVPPDFDKDPQTDWPLIGPNGQTGGYTEGCCDQAGFLYIPEVGNGGVRIGHTTDPNEWEGIFHWNDLLSSQFLVSGTSGEPKVRFKYEVTPAMVGRPLNFTIGYREGGVTVDLFLFSTHTNLMEHYSQKNLDDLLINKFKLTVQDPGNVVGTGSNAWSYLILEGENYYSKANETPGVGFTKVYGDGAVTNFYGNPVLGTNTTASNKGALFTQTTFGQFLDKATYQVQFATPGTYYLYMRFTMFENGGNTNHYLNEDSFFVPPDFDKDPQTDWPLIGPNGQTGGYTEGCCDQAGFLYIPEVGNGGVRIGHTTDPNEWEGIFHWNDLLSSQFLVSGTSGEPKVRFKYEVTPAMVGRPLNFAIGYREGGVTIDLFLFSTHTNLMDVYSQSDLDQLLINPRPKLTIGLSGPNLIVMWPTSATDFVLETTSTLSPPNWTLVTTQPVVVGDQNSVTINVTTGNGYYRLKKP